MLARTWAGYVIAILLLTLSAPFATCDEATMSQGRQSNRTYSPPVPHPDAGRFRAQPIMLVVERMKLVQSEFPVAGRTGRMRQAPVSPRPSIFASSPRLSPLRI
jgi:hypothetical protein